MFASLEDCNKVMPFQGERANVYGVLLVDRRWPSISGPSRRCLPDSRDSSLMLSLGFQWLGHSQSAHIRAEVP